MSYRHTLEAALENLDDIRQMMSRFPLNGKIPSVEIDLTLQKLRNLYELMLMLNNQSDKEQEKTLQPKNEHTEPAVRSEPVIPSKQKPAVESGENEKLLTGTHSQVSVKEKAEILSDRFKGKETLHETLHHSLEQKEATLASAKPITDLRSAIGINDRFTFIRELFNNDSTAFEQIIMMLNSTGSLESALAIVRDQQWDMNSEAVEQLTALLKRKFINPDHE